ncbi:MAG: hypothetical protein IKF09_08970 [Clostridiales bacterium]|nr:hypothetical protein [Clostridiales bacterium]
MIKRLGKTKKSKQGAILIVVVLILALAMIFIASALMLTQATRTRLYENAMSSQARLTVTAASEVFLEALEMQELTDLQLEDYIKESPAGPHEDKDKIKMLIDDVPGMTEADDNCTLLDLYCPDYTGDMRKDVVYADFTTTIGVQTENIRIILTPNKGVSTYGMRFKNQIDINGSAETTNMHFTQGVGMTSTAVGNPTDNVILIRGNKHDTAGRQVYYSDIVFAANGSSKFGVDSDHYYGRLIFLKGSSFDPGVSSVISHVHNDIYFLGSDTDEGGFVNDTDNQWNNISSTKFIFSGRLAQNDQGKSDIKDNSNVKNLLDGDGKTCYFLDKDGHVLTSVNNYNKTSTPWTVKPANVSGSVPSDISSRLSTYKSYGYNTGADPFPVDVVTDVFLDINPDGKIETLTAGTVLTRDEYEPIYDDAGEKLLYTNVWAKGTQLSHDVTVVKNPLTTTCPAKDSDGNAVTVMAVSKIAEKCGSTGGVWMAAPGYYKFTQGTSGEISGLNSSQLTNGPFIVAIDGAKADKYRFYFGSGNYKLNDLLFVVYNVTDTTKPVIFVLENNVHIETNTTADKAKDEQKWLCFGGILSMNRDGFTASTDAEKTALAGTIKSYVMNTAGGTWGGESGATQGGEEIVYSTSHVDFKDHQIYMSKYHDGEHKPCAYVYGTGNDFLGIGRGMMFEAYIGMYGNSIVQKLPMGTGAKKIVVYGRIETDGFGGGDNSEGNFQMPYCPAPTAISSEEDYSIATTMYEVTNIIYYY